MDLVRSELLAPVIVRDLHRAAEQHALAVQAVQQRGRGRLGFVANLGAALILAGCRLQSAGQRLAATSPFAAQVPCGCSA